MSVKTQRDKAIVQTLRERVRYDSASFGNYFPSKDDPLPQTEDEVDAFIRRRVDLYVTSWILPLLDELEGISVSSEKLKSTKPPKRRYR